MVFEDIKSRQGNRSFVAYAFEADHFPFHLHYHPEFELTLITKGRGERMVGDRLCYFEAGDLVLMGANVPHTWTSREQSSAVVIQFSQTFMQAFLSFEEFKDIKNLLKNAQYGLFFPSHLPISSSIQALPAQEGFFQVLKLLEILHHLAHSSFEWITTHRPFVFNQQSEKRINKVCHFIQENYQKPLPLREIAGLIHLSESAFCKFFKKTTGKTFSEYVNFIRVQAVCRALQESDNTIAEIAFASGFESLTYFNRVFKTAKGMTPKTFRKVLD